MTNNDKISKYNLLILFKKIFELNNIDVDELNTYEVDKSLINTRNDYFINIPSYEKMIFEMKEWINIYNLK